MTPDEMIVLKSELDAARRKIALLERTSLEPEVEFSRMATFPEQNPNMVIEVAVGGEVKYLNPVAAQDFPDLLDRGWAHPVLAGLSEIVRHCREDRLEYISREIDLGTAVYEQKICMVGEDLVHIYSHDITALRRAEESVVEMAGQLRLLAQRVVLAQEQERKRIARELHDEAGQALIVLKLSLELLLSELAEGQEDLAFNLEEAVRLTDQTRNQIRMLAQGLRPPVLDTLGIGRALEEYCQDFGRRTGLEIGYQGGEIDQLPEAVSVCLYRCLQEALANVARHAQARKVNVMLAVDAADIVLRVQDDGCGIPESQLDGITQHGSGIGLLGMRERLELLGGHLDISSRHGRGVDLSATIPIGENR